MATKQHIYTQSTIDKLEARSRVFRLILETLSDAEETVPEIFDDGRLYARRAQTAIDLEMTLERLAAARFTDATQMGG